SNDPPSGNEHERHRDRRPACYRVDELRIRITLDPVTVHPTRQLVLAEVVRLVVDDLVALRCLEEKVDETLQDLAATRSTDRYLAPKTPTRYSPPNWFALAGTFDQAAHFLSSLRDPLSCGLRSSEVVQPFLRGQVNGLQHRVNCATDG